MDNSDKIILDLCGGTGAWSKPYRDAGYDVRLITLPENNVLTYEPPEGVYGILAAPPCTEFSLAKTTAPRNLKSGFEIVRACLEIVWKCRINGGLKFWAMENPVGLLRQFIGRPKYTFHQWQFGVNRDKATDVWGYFKSPASMVEKKPEGLTRRNPCGTTNSIGWGGKQQIPPEYFDYIRSFKGYVAQRAAARAITPPGFAQAFFKANK
jgi:hypothetical protein